MNYHDFLSLIEYLIKKGEISDALKRFDYFLKDSSFSDEISHLQSRYATLSKQIRQGIISHEKATLENNKITNAFIQIISSLKSNKVSKKNYYKQSIRRGAISSLPSIVFIATLAATIYFVYLFLQIFGPLFFPQTTIIKGEDIISRQEDIISRQEDIQTAAYNRIKFRGTDKNNNSAEYFLYITKDFNWKKGEDATSERLGVEKKICLHFAEHKMIYRINHDTISRLYAFGNASYEENLSIKNKAARLRAEEDRAAFRARKLASCVGDQLKTLTPVYTINLGKHLNKEIHSNYQRLIVVIGLIKEYGPTIHKEALYDGLVKEHSKGNLQFDIRDFSRVQDEALDVQKFIN